VGIAPRLPTTHRLLPLADTSTPVAFWPSMTGASSNSDSHPTLSAEIWHLVLPDLVSM
jgi:hypothetical protein